MVKVTQLRDELAALRFAVAPLLVWSLSQVVFESVAFDLDLVTGQLSGALAAETDGLPASPAIEASARILWAGALLLFFLVAGTVLAYSSSLLLADLSRRALLVYAGMGVLLCAASLGHAALSSTLGNAFSTLYYFTRDALQACGCYHSSALARIDTTVTALNIMAAVVPPFALVAGCSALVVPSGNGVEVLAQMEQRMARLRTVLTGGSALLVTGLVHQVAWHRWPVVLAGNDAGLAEFVGSMSVYWGATYSLLIVAFYLPPALSMHRRARLILEANPDLAGGATAEDWLNAHGLSRSALHRLPQLAAMAAPLLAGPLGATLSGFGEAALPG
jgi:hypothetical protein